MTTSDINIRVFELELEEHPKNLGVEITNSTPDNTRIQEFSSITPGHKKEEVSTQATINDQPEGVLLLILKHLQEGTDSANYVQVCKEWNLLLPPLVSQLKLTKISRSLADFVHVTQFENVKVLQLDRCQAPEGGWRPFFEALGMKLKLLESLHLKEVLPKISGVDFSGFFRHSANLRKLALYDCVESEFELVLDNDLPLESLDITGGNHISPRYFYHLTSLRILALSSVSTIPPFPPMGSFTNLQSLNLSDCSMIELLPPLTGLSNLRDLNLFSSVGNFPCLSAMTQLTSLGQSWELQNTVRLTSLESLGIHFHPQHNRQPLTHMTRLTSLYLFDEVGVAELGFPQSLEYLSLTLMVNCPQLSEVLQGLTNLSVLKMRLGPGPHDSCELHLEGLTGLKELDISQWDHPITSVTLDEGLSSLEALALSWSCGPVSPLLVPTLRRLCISGFDAGRIGWVNAAMPTGLTELELYNSTSADLPSLDRVTEIAVLCVSDCPKVSALPPLSSLRKLQLSTLNRLTALQALAHMSRLEDLQLFSLPLLTELPDLSNLRSLQQLLLQDMNLIELPSLSGLVSLQALRLSDLNKLWQLPSLDGLTSIIELNVCSCADLQYIPQLTGLFSLRYLTLKDCARLVFLPPLQGLTQLRELILVNYSAMATAPSLAPCLDGVNPELEIQHSVAELDLGEFGFIEV